ncbi:phosphatidylinositol polyphosphate 5-phosphatase type IV-like [Rhinoderma darwinii]|uniref:phosphatidylinositol polyphosphate 5-phosphatase type IV-like n=1 Tax=Rhinoderma darwinii TaxID=43563 RepID=UPI003F67D952
MEEPNISLQKFSVIKDMADEKSSDLSHSKYCDITSKNTKKSAFSLLTRLRSKNIRKRNFGSSAVIGARELDRYFPDRRLRLYVATWNMEGKDYPQNVEDLLLPSDDTKDIYVIGVQEGFGAVNKRIQDYKTITEGLRLPQIIPERINSNALDVTSRFDRVFWFGDLNFQLKEDRKNVESLLQKIEGKDMSSLLKHDHLNEAKNNGSIFLGFKEHTIDFLPTYKFDIGTDTYDTSAKQRIPSYTDRVLFKSQCEGDVRVLRYDSCPVLKTSDHRPVFGIFEVKIRPGSDDIPLAGGRFDRKIYVTGIRRKGQKK